MYAERPSTWAPPREFGEYVIERCLGGGAMGTVYLARDHVLDRPVAIKFIAAAYPSHAVRERFMVEARAAARMSHPNVATVHRVGDLQGRPYLVSEFVEGEALSELSLPIPEPEALRLALGVARGLAEAHRHGVLHRDIKPANVLVGTGGIAKLVDFGLAKLLEQDLQPDQSSEVTGEVEAPGPTGDLESSGLEPGEMDPPQPVVLSTADVPDVVAPTGDVAGPQSSQGVFLTAPPTGDVPGPPETRPVALTAAATRDVPEPSSRGLTRAGAVMGTPDYMPPEVWEGETAVPASDVYALGAVLYELLTGAPPFAHVEEEQLEATVLSQDAPRLSDTAPHVGPRVADLVARCLRREANERFASAESLRDELEILAREERLTVEGNPFRGLQPFEAQHRATFFGREMETDEILGQLSRKAFVIVTGDSGTGKSSVCRASAVPASTHSGLGDGRSWAAVTVTPGPQPLTRVSAALSGIVRRDVDTLAEDARRDPGSVATRVQSALGRTRGVICFVDQLEELVTQNAGEEGVYAERFLAALASGFPGIKVLATARADFLTRLASLPSLGPEVPGAIYLLRSMTREQVRRAIEGPTHAADLRFESDELVDELLSWIDEAHTSLPILQFALARWWEVRDEARGLLTREGLGRIGGVGGALAQQADRVLAGMVGPRRAQARELLLRLVGSDGVRVTKNVADLTDGDRVKQASLDQLVAGRLLAVGEGLEGATVTLVHDVLIREWATLADWVREAAATTRVRERLDHAAREWESLGQPISSLLQGPLLDDASALRFDELNSIERRFVVASRRRRNRQRILRAALALAVPLGIVATYLTAQVRSRMVLDAQIGARLDRAQTALEEASALEIRALTARRRAAQLFRSWQRDEGEKRWVDVAQLESALGSRYRDANQALESAVALAPDRSELRERFGDLLLARVGLAHRRRAFEQRDELLVRLALYDDDGRRHAAWSAPGTVAVRGLPEDGTIQLGGGGDAADLRRGLGLPPGSHLARVDWQGLKYALPFVVEAGEHISLDASPPSSGSTRNTSSFLEAGFSSAARRGRTHDSASSTRLLSTPRQSRDFGSGATRSPSQTGFSFLRRCPLKKSSVIAPGASTTRG